MSNISCQHISQEPKKKVMLGKIMLKRVIVPEFERGFCTEL
jgi:hypothetical protein